MRNARVKHARFLVEHGANPTLIEKQNVVRAQDINVLRYWLCELKISFSRRDLYESCLYAKIDRINLILKYGGPDATFDNLQDHEKKYLKQKRPSSQLAGLIRDGESKKRKK